MPITEEMKLQAVAIADSAMAAQLESHAPGWADADDRRFALVDMDGDDVQRLEDADPAIVEAFNWLYARGYAVLRKDEHSAWIELTEKALAA